MTAVELSQEELVLTAAALGQIVKIAGAYAAGYQQVVLRVTPDQKRDLMAIRAKLIAAGDGCRVFTGDAYFEVPGRWDGES